jgi:hypothetical protein
MQSRHGPGRRKNDDEKSTLNQQTRKHTRQTSQVEIDTEGMHLRNRRLRGATHMPSSTMSSKLQSV